MADLQLHESRQGGTNDLSEIWKVKPETKKIEAVFLVSHFTFDVSLDEVISNFKN